MEPLQETSLPGLGVRFEITTSQGATIGVVQHHTGRKELFVGDAADPDSTPVSVDLTPDEAHALVEALGGTRVTETLRDLQQGIEGLAIDWLTVSPGSQFSDRALGEARIRTTTGVSVVAVLRGDATLPSPGPDHVVREGDTMVLVGTPNGISRVFDLFRSD